MENTNESGGTPYPILLEQVVILKLIKQDLEQKSSKGKEYDSRLHEFYVLKLREQRTLKDKLNSKMTREKNRQAKIDAGETLKKRGRQPKYKNDEERKEAARKQRKAWYEKTKRENPEKIKQYKEKSRLGMQRLNKQRSIVV